LRRDSSSVAHNHAHSPFQSQCDGTAQALPTTVGVRADRPLTALCAPLHRIGGCVILAASVFVVAATVALCLSLRRPQHHRVTADEGGGTWLV
jgi:hypothetical protein